MKKKKSLKIMRKNNLKKQKKKILKIIEFLNLFVLESEQPFKGEYESVNEEKENYENVIDNNNELNNTNK